MELGIKDKRALVLGASRGIGNAIARELAKEGARVMLSARTENRILTEVQSIKKEIADHSEVYGFACDLDLSEARNSLIKEVEERFGGVDILVHNTGGPSPSFTSETSQEQWQTGFDKLFQSLIELNQAFLPGMKTNNWGRILCVTSLSVLEPIKTLAVSNAIRSAVTSMLKSLADEVAPFNITVNCIAPGAIATERLNELMEARIKRSGQTKEEYEKEYLESIPAGRLGRPEEFAAAAAFLASERASYITGSTICVDGGKRRSTY
ncbi:SDR family oxidoreductase [bacterium]|nr:SDR family oxidoreductase [bacterium]